MTDIDAGTYITAAPSAWREAIRRELPLLLICATYCLVVYAIARVYDRPFELFLYAGPIGFLLALAMIVLAAARLVRLISYERHPRALVAFGREVATHFTDPTVIVSYLGPVVSIALFVSAFTTLKGMIPLIHPFSWDVAFHHLDTALHFGLEPWRATHALIGDLGTAMLDLNYGLWFAFIWLSVLFAIMAAGESRLRQRYLISFALVWIVVGSVMALMLSSAGPCYYGAVVNGVNPYAPLMADLAGATERLRAAEAGHIPQALETQALLWSFYAGKVTNAGAGISAMPSMHVATSTLMALAAFRVDRRLGWSMTVFAAAVLVGSVHLGWHYAIDGYVAIAAVLAIWHLVGRLTGDIRPR